MQGEHVTALLLPLPKYVDLIFQVPELPLPKHNLLFEEGIVLRKSLILNYPPLQLQLDPGELFLKLGEHTAELSLYLLWLLPLQLHKYVVLVGLGLQLLDILSQFSSLGIPFFQNVLKLLILCFGEFEGVCDVPI